MSKVNAGADSGVVEPSWAATSAVATASVPVETGASVTAAGVGPPVEGGPLDSDRRAMVRWEVLDVTQQAQVGEVVERTAPELILHLAAISRVLDAVRDPGQAYDVNTVGTVRLLTEVARLKHASACDPALTRPVDLPVQIGNNAKLRHATGWTPRHTREDIIDDLIHAATR